MWETYLTENRPRFLNELLDFLRIPSILALPDHADDVQRSAGIEGVRVLPTDGLPVVYGEWLHAPGRPTILIYGHFDTQAADPLEIWSSSPFEPDIRDGRIYARGASDDKGNMLIPRHRGDCSSRNPRGRKSLPSPGPLTPAQLT
jgi:acetylornithine deacetylase/succinyl-diaminopimelate desuccinylase-like protein